MQDLTLVPSRQPIIRIGTFASHICVMSMVFGAAGLGSMQSRRARFFPEDQIQLIAIEARVFHDLADLETERQCRVVRS
jgi:hypothetical protein